MALASTVPPRRWDSLLHFERTAAALDNRGACFEWPGGNGLPSKLKPGVFMEVDLYEFEASILSGDSGLTRENGADEYQE